MCNPSFVICIVTPLIRIAQWTIIQLNHPKKWHIVELFRCHGLTSNYFIEFLDFCFIFCYLLPYFPDFFHTSNLTQNLIKGFFFKKRQGSRISLNFIEVIGADRKNCSLCWLMKMSSLRKPGLMRIENREEKKLKRKRETNEFISHMRSAWSYIVQFDGKILLFSHKKRCQKSFSVLIEPRGCTTAPKQNV